MKFDRGSRSASLEFRAACQKCSRPANLFKGYLVRLLAVLFLFLALDIVTGAQVLTVEYYSSGGWFLIQSPDGVVYIDSTPRQPTIRLEMLDVCGTVEYTMDVYYVKYWTDSHGVTHSYESQANYAGSMPCSTPTQINWSQSPYFEGGTAAIYWDLYDANGVYQTSGISSFNIYACNPTNPQVDDAIFNTGGPPWFYYYTVSYESHYSQFGAQGSTGCQQAPTYGYPAGFGLSQVDASVPGNTVNDNDLWNWEKNVEDGVSLALTKQRAAYSYEENQVQTMVASQSGGFVTTNWPADCRNNAAICAADGPSGQTISYNTGTYDCSFTDEDSPPSTNGLGDGDWIHSYNSNYFEKWNNPGTLGQQWPNGVWEYDDQGSGQYSNGYVWAVCTSPLR